MCWWKSYRTKLLQWWIIEDGAGDLWCLWGAGTGTGTSFALWTRGIIQCDLLHSCAPLVTQFHPCGPTVMQTQPTPTSAPILLSYFLSSSMLHQMMVHWESQCAWKRKISLCARKDSRCLALLYCPVVHTAIKLTGEFFLGFFLLKKKKNRTKGLKKHKALRMHPDYITDLTKPHD